MAEMGRAVNRLNTKKHGTEDIKNALTKSYIINVKCDKTNYIYNIVLQIACYVTTVVNTH